MPGIAQTAIRAKMPKMARRIRQTMACRPFELATMATKKAKADQLKTMKRNLVLSGVWLVGDAAPLREATRAQSLT